MYVCIYLSIDLSIYLSIYIYISTCMYIHISRDSHLGHLRNSLASLDYVDRQPLRTLAQQVSKIFFFFFFTHSLSYLDIYLAMQACVSIYTESYLSTWGTSATVSPPLITWTDSLFAPSPSRLACAHVERSACEMLRTAAASVSARSKQNWRDSI